MQQPPCVLEWILVFQNPIKDSQSVDTVFCPGLKSKFSNLESCFGSGIHFPFNPNSSKSFKSKFSSSEFKVMFCSIQINPSPNPLKSKEFEIVCNQGYIFVLLNVFVIILLYYTLFNYVIAFILYCYYASVLLCYIICVCDNSILYNCCVICIFYIYMLFCINLCYITILQYQFRICIYIYVFGIYY